MRLRKVRLKQLPAVHNVETGYLLSYEGYIADRELARREGSLPSFLPAPAI